MDLAKEIAVTLGLLDASVVPQLQFDITANQSRQRSHENVMRKPSVATKQGYPFKHRSGSDASLDTMTTWVGGARRSQSDKDGMNVSVTSVGGDSATSTPLHGNSNSTAPRDARVNRDAVIAAVAATIAAAAAHGAKPLALLIEECDKLDSSGWHLLSVLCSIGADAAGAGDTSTAGTASETPESAMCPPRRCFIMVTHGPLNPLKSVKDQAHEQALTLMGARRVPLEPLDVRATQDIVEQLFGGRKIDLPLAEVMHVKTSGIPLYVQQLVAFIEQEGDFDLSPPAVGGDVIGRCQ
jgi:hypothetical protein